MEISNYSDKFLRINDILITDDANGEVFINYVRVSNAAGIKDANIVKDGEAKPDNNISVTSNSGGNAAQPEITIRNDGNPSSNRTPNLELLGDIINPLGTVTITSEGSIESRGSILARIINIEAKQDFVQTAIKNEFIFHVGGDPRQVWNSVANTNENNKTSTTNNTSRDESSFWSSSIIANNVYISGTYLDINGLIQAGRADWTLTVNDTILLNFGDGSIASAVKDYLGKNSSTANPLYKLDPSHGNLTAYYNVVTGNIEVASVNIDGGKLYLYGNIINTSATGAGRLVALDGYARVTITNNSTSDIILNNINTDKKINGEIKITDLAQKVTVGGKLVPLETTYTFENGQIRTVTNTGGNSLSQTASYTPKSGLRYTWTSGSQDVIKEIYYYESNSFWGMDFLVPDKQDEKEYYSHTVKDPLMRGAFIVDNPSDSGTLYKYVYEYRGYERELINREYGSYNSGWWIFSTHTDWIRLTYQRGENHFNTHSIKADNPISIGFIGYANPQNIAVNAATSVGLRGSINSGASADVNITSGGAIDGLSAGAQISGRNITLNAVNGIGNYNPVTVSLKGGVFNAVNSGIGNIDLIAKTNGGGNVLRIGNVTAADGGLRLISDEEIAANSANSKVKGTNTEIVSKNGAITGYNGAALEIEADTLKADAYGDIKLTKKTDGDLGIHTVWSASGDIYLNVEKGSVHDVNTNFIIDERKKSELLALWDDMLGLFDDNHIWTQDQLLYAMNGARAGGGSNPYIKEDNFRGRNVTIDTGASVGLNEKSFYINMEGFSFSQLDESQKLLIAGADYHNTTWHWDDPESVNKKLIGITIANQKDVNIKASENLNINSKGYVYVSSKESLRVNQILAGGNVRLTSAGNIYNAALDNKPSITGNDVLLISETGSIGTSDKKFTLDMMGVLTAAAQEDIYLYSDNNLSLNYLSSNENVFIDSKGNIYAAGYDSSDYENISARLITINAANVGTTARSLNIALSGSDAVLNASAAGNIYIGNAGGHGSSSSSDLYYGKLIAGEYVSLMSKYGAIRGIDEDSLITAKNLILKAESFIGTSDNKVKAEVDEVITAFAKGDIYIEAQGMGKFEEIESAEGLVDLSSTGNLYADKVIADKNISIVSPGSIETGTQYITSKNGGINITGKKEVEVNAAVSAKGDIEMKSEESDLKVAGSVISSEGDAGLSSEGKTEITGNITTDKDITADSKKELIVKGDLKSDDGGVDLKSGERTDIEGSVTAKEDIISLVENGNLNIKGAIRSFEGNINFNILNGALIIGNKAVSERGSVFAEAYGDIIMGEMGISGAGIYSDEITLISQNGDIGKQNRRLYLDSENPVSVLANLEALNGGIYVEGFTNGLTIDRFEAENDLAVISNGDITAVYLGDMVPNITAANITLHSLSGSVGKEDSRIIAEPIKEKGRINLSAVTGIYLDQYVHTTFYSDYVRNSGARTVSLLVPDNNAFIVDLSISKDTVLNVNFVDNRYVKNIRIGYQDIKKLMVHPMAVWSPVFMTASEDRYRLLTGENIKDGIEKMQNETLIISSNLLQQSEE